MVYWRPARPGVGGSDPRRGGWSLLTLQGSPGWANPPLDRLTRRVERPECLLKFFEVCPQLCHSTGLIRGALWHPVSVRGVGAPVYFATVSSIMPRD